MNQCARYLCVCVSVLAAAGCTRGPDDVEVLRLLRKMGFQRATMTRKGKVAITASDLLARRNNELAETKLIRLASGRSLTSNRDSHKTLRVAALVTLAQEYPEASVKYVKAFVREKDWTLRQGALAAIDAQPSIRERLEGDLRRVAREDRRTQIATWAKELLQEMDSK